MYQSSQGQVSKLPEELPKPVSYGRPPLAAGELHHVDSDGVVEGQGTRADQETGEDPHVEVLHLARDDPKDYPEGQAV